MVEICDSKDCCGCGACLNICPNKCINIKQSTCGDGIPIVDESKCTNCLLCKKICPQNVQSELKKPEKCYASFSRDSACIDSASGGIAKKLYEQFLKCNVDAYVVGVILDESMKAKYKMVHCDQELSAFQGSKYVQADMDKIYSDIERVIKRKSSVLFIGLPCQTVAVRNYLKIRKVDIAKLLIVDLLCHGVSPQCFLDEELEYLKEKHKWDGVKKISFRSNRKFRNFHFYVEGEKKGKKIRYNRYSQEDPYFYGFLNGVSLRESCYNCKFSRLERCGDLTIGDFIGLGKMKGVTEYLGEKKENVSLIFTQTKKGADFLRQLDNSVYIEERPIEEAVKGGSSLNRPFEKSIERESFLLNYRQIGFVKAIQKASKKNLKRNKFTLKLKRAIFRLVSMIENNLKNSRISK